MVVVVLATQVVHVAGGHEWTAHLARDLDYPGVGPVLIGDAVLLNLEVDVVGPEHLHQGVGVGAGLRGRAVDQAAAEARLEAAGESDHALGMTRQQLQIDVGLAAPVALEDSRPSSA